MTSPSIDAWHDVGEFEIEDQPEATAIVSIFVARDPAAGFFVKVGDDEASIERMDSPDLLVAYFARYGAPYLIDLRRELAGVAGFEEVCQLADRRLKSKS